MHYSFEICLIAGFCTCQSDSAEKTISDAVKHLESNDVEVRRDATFTLSFIKASRTIPALLKALHDPDAEVRVNAANAFNFHTINASESFREASKPAIPVLAELLSDKEESVRRSASGALFSLGSLSHQCLPALKKVMNDNNQFVRIYSRAAVVRLSAGKDGDEALRSILEFARVDDKEVRSAAQRVFTYLGIQAIPFLKDGLKDKSPMIREWTVGSFASVMMNETERDKFPAEAIHQLTDAINDDNTEVATSAMYAVSLLGPAAKDAIPAIVKRFNDADWQIRVYAISRTAD